MKKISLILASLLIVSSSAYAKTPAERQAIACDSQILRNHEVKQTIQENRAPMTDNQDMHEKKGMMCKKCKHQRRHHHHKKHAEKAAKAAAKNEAKTESKSK